MGKVEETLFVLSGRGSGTSGGTMSMVSSVPRRRTIGGQPLIAVPKPYSAMPNAFLQ